MRWSVALACLFGLPAALAAQDYPVRPLRIVTATPGGGNDFVARLVAQGITGPMGQPVIVDNRGPGVIPIEYTAKTSPDGYVLLVNGQHALDHLLVAENKPVRIVTSGAGGAAVLDDLCDRFHRLESTSPISGLDANDGIQSIADRSSRAANY